MMEHTDPARIVAHIVWLDVEDQDVGLVSKLFSRYPQASVHFYIFDAGSYGHFRVDGHVSLASYIRLFLADLLPQDVDKLVYLDSDICVLADIRDLAATYLDDAVIAAVCDPYAEENERLGLPDGYRCFNAGILVMDMAAWRRLKLSAAAKRYVDENAPRLKYHDQDVLNVLLHDKVKFIDMAWNYQARLRQRNTLTAPPYRSQLVELIRIKPQIVHYTTHLKPWRYRPDVAFEREYMKYLKLTPWAQFRQPDKNFKAVIRRYINRLSPKATAWIARALDRVRASGSTQRLNATDLMHSSQERP